MEDDNTQVSTQLLQDISKDISVKLENDSQSEEVVVTLKTECLDELSSISELKSEDADILDVTPDIKKNGNLVVDSSSEIEHVKNSTLDNFDMEISEEFKIEEPSDTKESFSLDLKVQSLFKGEPGETFDLNNAVSASCLLSNNIVSACGENVDTRVIVKRKSDSLALISSYEINTDSEEDVSNDVFLKPQILSETDLESDSDSDTDGLPIFNVYVFIIVILA